MATPNASIAPDQPPAETAPAETAAPARRTVTLPVLPLAIVAAVVVALLFFAGGTALGFAIANHPTRVGIIQPFGGQYNGQNPNGQNPNGQNPNGQNRRNGGTNGQNGFGQNGGQRPGQLPTGAPKNG
jgi:hypothetical protein